LGANRLGRETDNSRPSSAEIKNSGVVPPLPLLLHGVLFIKHGDNFSSYLYVISVRTQLGVSQNTVPRVTLRPKVEEITEASGKNSQSGAS
jgi:hypothetical protein